MKLHQDQTTEEIQRIRNGADQCPPDDEFARARRIVPFLGAHMIDADTARFGFWTPELAEEQIPPEQVFLDLYEPPPGFDPQALPGEVTFRCVRIRPVRDGQYTWAVVGGVAGGTRMRWGTFYRLGFHDAAGVRRTIVDPLAHSVPFGAAAPAELYDIPALFHRRADSAYFKTLDTSPDPDGVPRVNAPVHMLEIHVPTATAGGTLAALTHRYREITATGTRTKNAADHPAGDLAYLGYEAVQLMPVEPTILHEAGDSFWDELAHDGDIVRVALRTPDTTNWGYDVITAASPAPNPTLLETGRPDELLDFITTMHTLPAGPVKVVLDVVYGHADNQTLALLNRHFFAGANMYGQNLNYRHPVVRAVLLEMQRRKSNYGVDGIRVDGAQDFKYYVEAEDRLYHDDRYLALMNDLEQEAAGVRYRPWMVFEDGRPWPRDDWELASTYREVTRLLPNVVQWGPLTFAHNTPFLFTFWISKWWRIRELLEAGSHWITGNSNHDTLRRGTQVDPEERLNTYLGNTLPEIFENGYDNPAARLLDCFLPGIPMDFLNANVRGPWSFVRNTDAKWAIKVVSEEARFLDWNVSPERFNQDWAFPRLKARGFRSLRGLRQFLRALDGAVRTTEYSPEAIAAVLNSIRPHLEGPREITGDLLRRIAREWMEDVHEFCNTDRYVRRINIDPRLQGLARFARSVREFRRRHRWLAGNLAGRDRFEYIHPTEGTVLMYGIRTEPRPGVAEIAFLGNMEGAPREIVPAELLERDSSGWRPVLTVPSVKEPAFSGPLVLRNSEAVLFARNVAE